jgi:hypothetical protein
MVIAMDHFFLQAIDASISENLYDEEHSIDDGPAEHY